jgi:hypothetical protein
MPVGLAGLTCSLPVLPAVGGVCGVDGPVFVCAIADVPTTTAATINVGRSEFIDISFIQYVHSARLVAAAAAGSTTA